MNRSGTYRLRVTDEHHCVGEESIRVTSAECLEGVYIPNAFTPNNDGRNDLFKPMVFGKLQNYHLIVYNRFGQKVFETGDASRGWNGSKNGLLTSKGIYVLDLYLSVCRIKCGNEEGHGDSFKVMGVNGCMAKWLNC